MRCAHAEASKSSATAGASASTETTGPTGPASGSSTARSPPTGHPTSSRSSPGLGARPSAPPVEPSHVSSTGCAHWARRNPERVAQDLGLRLLCTYMVKCVSNFTFRYMDVQVSRFTEHPVGGDQRSHDLLDQSPASVVWAEKYDTNCLIRTGR